MNVSNPIKFGTDGWRGLIARDFTFDNVAICAAGYARYLEETGLGARGIVIGYDTRFLSTEFALETASVITAAGIRVILSDSPVPTPVVSFSTMSRNAGGAVVLTASHNSAQWNGFKIKSPTGSSAATSEVSRVENHINSVFEQRKPPDRLSQKQAVDRGLLEYADLAPSYFDQLQNLLDLESLRRSGIKIVVDSMHGAGAGYFRKLLGDNYPLVEIRSEINPAFPGMQQPEPISNNLQELKQRVPAEGAAAGLATDGDADRIGIIDEQGNFLTQLQVMSLLTLYLLQTRGQRGAIIKTITTSGMLNKLGQMYQVPVFETPVGFKNIAPMMERENAIIGGEESGGYGFKNHVLERDAILAGLYFLDFMIRTEKKPSELLNELYSKVSPHDYQRIDVSFEETDRQAVLRRLEAALPEKIDGNKVEKDTIDGFRFSFEDGAWLLIRASGTEPLLRIYAEADSMDRVKRLLEAGQKLAGV